MVLKHERIRIQLPEKKHFARPQSDRNSALFHDESSLFEILD